MASHLITFGDGSYRWRQAGKRLARQAKQSGWFASIHRWTARRLHRDIPKFARENPFLDLEGSRGYGYWLWRPYILQNELKSLSPGDCLLYLDAGCQLNITASSIQRFSQYLALVQANGGMVMRMDVPLASWCKRDLLDQFGLGDDVRGVVEPGVMFLRKTEENLQLIADWIRWGRANHYHYLDDSPSLLRNAPEFREHRHDQAIVSCLLLTHSLYSIPQETYFPNNWRVGGERYPIWALRNSTPFVLESNGLLSRSVTQIRNLKNQ